MFWIVMFWIMLALNFLWLWLYYFARGVITTQREIIRLQDSAYTTLLAHQETTKAHLYRAWEREKGLHALLGTDSEKAN